MKYHEGTRFLLKNLMQNFPLEIFFADLLIWIKT